MCTDAAAVRQPHLLLHASTRDQLIEQSPHHPINCSHAQNSGTEYPRLYVERCLALLSSSPYRLKLGGLCNFAEHLLESVILVHAVINSLPITASLNSSVSPWLIITDNFQATTKSLSVPHLMYKGISGHNQE